MISGVHRVRVRLGMPLLPCASAEQLLGVITCLAPTDPSVRLSRTRLLPRVVRVIQPEPPACERYAHGEEESGPARARASIVSGVARRPASHVRYDSGDAPSITANAACDWPSAIRHSRSVRGSTTSHHAIGAGRCEARRWGWAYFSQPILEGDRSLCSPAPSPLVPRQWAQSANSLGKWRARQDSNLRPSA